MVDVEFGMVVDGGAVVVGRRRMGRDSRVVEDMKVGRKFAEVGSKRLETDLDRRMFGSRKDLVIAVHKNLQNHPL